MHHIKDYVSDYIKTIQAVKAMQDAWPCVTGVSAQSFTNSSAVFSINLFHFSNFCLKFPTLWGESSSKTVLSIVVGCPCTTWVNSTCYKYTCPSKKKSLKRKLIKWRWLWFYNILEFYHSINVSFVHICSWSPLCLKRSNFSKY